MFFSFRFSAMPVASVAPGILEQSELALRLPREKDFGLKNMGYLRNSVIVQMANEDGLFGAHCPAFDNVGACTATGTSVEEAVVNVTRAVAEFVSFLRGAGVTPPSPERNPVVRVVPATLDAAVYHAVVRQMYAPC